MPLVLGRARRSGRGATGGADHIRSSLSVVLTDAAPVSTAAVASSRPREHAEAAPWHGSRREGATSKTT